MQELRLHLPNPDTSTRKSRDALIGKENHRRKNLSPQLERPAFRLLLFLKYPDALSLVRRTLLARGFSILSEHSSNATAASTSNMFVTPGILSLRARRICALEVASDSGANAPIRIVVRDIRGGVTEVSLLQPFGDTSTVGVDLTGQADADIRRVAKVVLDAGRSVFSATTDQQAMNH